MINKDLQKQIGEYLYYYEEALKGYLTYSTQEAKRRANADAKELAPHIGQMVSAFFEHKKTSRLDDLNPVIIEVAQFIDTEKRVINKRFNMQGKQTKTHRTRKSSYTKTTDKIEQIARDHGEMKSPIYEVSILAEIPQNQVRDILIKELPKRGIVALLENGYVKFSIKDDQKIMELEKKMADVLLKAEDFVGVAKSLQEEINNLKK